MFLAQFAAPPGIIVRRSSRMTGIGPSGEILSTATST
jgi:hypothetical protein